MTVSFFFFAVLLLVMPHAQPCVKLGDVLPVPYGASATGQRVCVNCVKVCAFILFGFTFVRVLWFHQVFFTSMLFRNGTAQIPLGSSRHVSTRYDTTRSTCRARRNELVEPCCSSSTQPKCMGSTRGRCHSVSRRNVTSQVEFGFNYNGDDDDNHSAQLLNQFFKVRM